MRYQLDVGLIFRTGFAAHTGIKVALSNKNQPFDEDQVAGF